MKFAHITDSHICLPEPESSNRLVELRQVVEQINQMNDAPELVIHSGDIVHNGSEEEYQAAYEILSCLKAALFVIPGNKDYRKVMGRVFSKELGDSANKVFFQYIIDTEAIRFIMLDTLDEGERLGTLCEKRLRNFSSMLGQNKTKRTIVFMHHPPFDVVEAPQPFQFDSQETVEKFEAIVKNNSQISAIYCGHSHRYGKNTIGQVPVSAISSIAIDLRWGKYDAGMDNQPVFEVYEL